MNCTVEKEDVRRLPLKERRLQNEAEHDEALAADLERLEVAVHIGMR